MSKTTARYLFLTCIFLAGMIGYISRELFVREKVITLPDGIYIGTNGVVYSIAGGKSIPVVTQVTNVTVITRSGMVATTEIRLP